jgi:hypothetical protein
MAKVLRAKRSELQRLGISNLKRDRSAFSINLGDKTADVVVRKNGWGSVDYDVLGFRTSDKKHEGLGTRIPEVREAVVYVAKISGIKAYGIQWLI